MFSQTESHVKQLQMSIENWNGIRCLFGMVGIF